MPLEDHFTQQIDAIRDFMAEPGTSLCRLVHDADAGSMVLRILIGLHDEDSPHSLIFCDAPFESDAKFFRAALGHVAANNEQARDALAAQGVTLPPAPEGEDRAAFARYLCDVRESLPERVGGYVIVLAPEQVSDVPGFVEAMVYLAEHLTAEGVKVLVQEPRQEPRLAGIEERCERAVALGLDFGPQGVEAQLLRDLAGNELSLPERGKYLGMAGGFSAGRQDFDRAIEQQAESARLLAEHGEPADHANALYALGTTRARAGCFAEAEQALASAVALCLDHGLHALLALALTNLGVVLQGLGRIEEAVQSFDVAAQTFDGLGHLPGKAHALDTKATSVRLAGRNEEAEQAWLEALGLYESLTSNQFEDLRAAGSRQVRDKLAAFYRETEQPAKAARLQGSA